MADHYVPSTDGITHVNVYSKGRTILGRMLSNFASTRFIIGDYTFQSVESWWYWKKMLNANSELIFPLYSSSQLDEIRLLVGAQAKAKYREHSNDSEKFNPTKEELKIVYLAKLDQHPPIKELLVNNKLPLAHYYVVGGNKINADKFLWTVDLWNEIVNDFSKQDRSNGHYE